VITVPESHRRTDGRTYGVDTVGRTTYCGITALLEHRAVTITLVHFVSSTLGNPTPLFFSVGYQEKGLFPCDSAILDVFHDAVGPGDARSTDLGWLGPSGIQLSVCFARLPFLHPLYVTPPPKSVLRYFRQ